ncbi:MAG: tetratricopeptide repeat protein [Candidatus Acidiferrales bacterium]
MAFNKNKALESALKFLNQGKVAQAISEYQLILRNDPKDQATLMTVGDLYARQGDMSQAIEYFERLAQVYLHDGFNSKAIAIYKKIAKLAPAELEPLERLADLYVQQGVLSEARPLFLQIAEAYLRSNQAPKAVEVLHRLLEVEPENQRVQMRLAELYATMGLKKDAALTYLAYAQRLFERGDSDEAEKIVERALQVDPGNTSASLLKARTLNAANKLDQAVELLSKHPLADAGGEVTNLLVDCEFRAGHTDRATERARKQLGQGHAHCALLHKVADTIIDGVDPAQALSLLTELRGLMIEAGTQDAYLKSLTRACEKLPGRTEPLELLVDFCRITSDPFRLNPALSQLSDAYAARGNYARAEELLVELVDRNKNDERLLERLIQLRARAGGSSFTTAAEAGFPESSAGAATSALGKEQRDEQQRLVPAAQPAILEETFDEETERYIAQALTDVDLFSSYGLTQKAMLLLENVLQRAPRHTPTLERLLDLHLGGGNDRRTAELAAQLEQIHRQRNDHVNADRFAELRLRYSKVAGLTTADMPAAPSLTAPPAASAISESAAPSAAAAKAGPPEVQAFTVPAAEAASSDATDVPLGSDTCSAAAAEPIEFEIALSEFESEAGAHGGAGANSVPVAEVPAEAVQETAISATQADEAIPAQSSPNAEELDLSDEWEAIIAEVEDSPAANEVAVVTHDELDPIVLPETESGEAEASETGELEASAEPAHDISTWGDEDTQQESPAEQFEIEANTPQSDSPPEPSKAEISLETGADSGIEAIETVEAHEDETTGPVQPMNQEELPTSLLEFLHEPAPEQPDAAQASSNEFDLELLPAPVPPADNPEPATTEDFISELVAELDDLEPPLDEPIAERIVVPAPPPPPVSKHMHLEEVFAEAGLPSAERNALAPAAGASNGSANGKGTPAAAEQPAMTTDTLNELAEVFQEFRSELGELGEEDEDLETHYNLGIAYREMGLLDEAIGEFQKVAKAIQKGKPFRYEMNCSTMLGLSFMDKHEPKVASFWYQRALQVPGLEDESIQALRYDLGLALESAGESEAALDCFRQVYAANIDYRDVADRIATLQKH